MSKDVIFFFLWPHLWHKEVPRLGVKSELQMLAYTTAKATQDPSCVCDLHYILWQCQIPNPLREASDWTHILMDTSQVLNPLNHHRNSHKDVISDSSKERGSNKAG